MYYVYARNVKSGREEFVNTYSDVKDAINKIYCNYKIDKDLRQLGEYFYFYKVH